MNALNGMLAFSARARGLPVSVRYIATSALVLLVLLLRLSMDIEGHVFLIFFPAIVLAALLFDRGSGFLATILSAIAADYFLIRPQHQFHVENASVIALIGIFLATGAVTSILIEGLHIATVRLQKYAEDLNLALADARRLNEEKDALMEEVHHRVKNNLQLVSSLLALQARRGENAAESLQAAADRVNVMGRVHVRLQHRLPGTTRISARDFIEELAGDLQLSVIGPRDIAIQTDIEDVSLSTTQASAIGLLINELVTNAAKHAFDIGVAGTITLSLRRDGDNMELRISDNGRGLPNDIRPGLGQQLVRVLVGQLRGELEVHKAPGTTYILRFPRIRRQGYASEDQRQKADDDRQSD